MKFSDGSAISIIILRNLNRFFYKHFEVKYLKQKQLYKGIYLNKLKSKISKIIILIRNFIQCQLSVLDNKAATDNYFYIYKKSGNSE